MAKVTTKLQVTVPKAIADQFGIRPGDEIEFQPAGDSIRIELAGKRKPLPVEERLRLFDESVKRQNRRQAGRKWPKNPPDRGWKREDLYERGRTR
jgi:AbrB family looped-hinge helix DNA binding protein